MKKAFVVVVLVFWCIFIFYNSSRSGLSSNNTSFNLLNDIKTEYHKITSKNSTVKIDENSKRNIELNFILRKYAHTFEYFILSILIFGFMHIIKIEKKKAYYITAAICLSYAALDEFHQLFVPGRAASVKDVLIDFVGSLIGLLLIKFVSTFKS